MALSWLGVRFASSGLIVRYSSLKLYLARDTEASLPPNIEYDPPFWYDGESDTSKIKPPQAK